MTTQAPPDPETLCDVCHDHRANQLPPPHWAPTNWDTAGCKDCVAYADANEAHRAWHLANKGAT